jgi:hypothetical protein
MSDSLKLTLSGPVGPAGASGKAIYSSSPPLNQTDGAVWFDTETGIKSFFYGGKWVSELTSLTLSSFAP